MDNMAKSAQEFTNENLRKKRQKEMEEIRKHAYIQRKEFERQEKIRKQKEVVQKEEQMKNLEQEREQLKKDYEEREAQLQEQHR